MFKKFNRNDYGKIAYAYAFVYAFELYVCVVYGFGFVLLKPNYIRNLK